MQLHTTLLYTITHANLINKQITMKNKNQLSTFLFLYNNNVIGKRKKSFIGKEIDENFFGIDLRLLGIFLEN